MTDEYKITELIPTDKPNEISVKMTFSGDPLNCADEF
jgi:hypothetical protein